MAAVTTKSMKRICATRAQRMIVWPVWIADAECPACHTLCACQENRLEREVQNDFCGMEGLNLPMAWAKNDTISPPTNTLVSNLREMMECFSPCTRSIIRPSSV